MIKAKVKKVSDKWIVRSSKIHGTGVFAKNDISKNVRIIQYIGEKITKREGDKGLKRG